MKGSKLFSKKLTSFNLWRETGINMNFPMGLENSEDNQTEILIKMCPLFCLN